MDGWMARYGSRLTKYLVVETLVARHILLFLARLEATRLLFTGVLDGLMSMLRVVKKVSIYYVCCIALKQIACTNNRVPLITSFFIYY